MCGRFTRKENMRQLAELLGLKVLPSLRSRYNIAPSQLVACVRTNPESLERECVELQWGLVPSWAKDPSIGNKMINARAETVAEKPSFRKSFKQQRCLVLADGFYEWKREGKTKQPYYIRFKDHRLFAFAGLWERWEKQEPALETCALITTGPNALMEPIHNRMPVILPEQAYASWLNPGLNNTVYLSGLLEPYPAEEMEAYPVSPMVNNPRNDQPECMMPVQ
ncbi:MAG: SOS response-associated peptidase [Nitrospirota bacterium]|nr:SOS response-associated peptidase [Nitrospirota bacterium]MDH5575549.1 SOS response-associated peptidase [Nitrospirota bacterium]